MLEILFLIWFGRKLSSIAQSKMRSGGGWAAFGVLMWIVPEITGAVVGSVLDLGAGTYVLAIVSAIIGAVIAYIVVSNLSDAGMPAGVNTGYGAVWPGQSGPGGNPQGGQGDGNIKL